MFVGGHGRIGDLADLTYYRDMCTIIRDRVQDQVKKGMTLAQVKAAKPAEDYDPRWSTKAEYVLPFRKYGLFLSRLVRG